MTDYLDRLAPFTPGDELELYMRELNREWDDEPGMDTLPTGPVYERLKRRGDGVRSLYADPYVRIASGTIYALSHQAAQDDHERRACFWEEMMELAQEAADAEWRLAKKDQTDD